MHQLLEVLVMNYMDRTVVGFVALVTFLASIGVVVRGNFAYPVELGLLLMLGVLLVISLMSPENDAATAFLNVLFFIAAIANVTYLYSVAGYLNTARLIALALGIGGLVMSGYNMLMQPVPVQSIPAEKEITSEVRKLMAAEQKLSDAKKRLEKVDWKDEVSAVAKAAGRKKGRRRK